MQVNEAKGAKVVEIFHLGAIHKVCTHLGGGGSAQRIGSNFTDGP